jgi:hypothetical protein
MFRLSKRRLAVLASEIPVREHRIGQGRPRTWGGCVERGLGTEHPCPFVSCKHHLYLDVNDRTGNIKLNFPDFEVHEIEETCALAAADRGGMTLEEVADALNLVRERIRQIERDSLRRLRGPTAPMLEDIDE